MTYHRDRPEPPQAACAGKWELFDSTDVVDHLEARELCHRCPLIDQCFTDARDTADRNAKLYGRGHISGTWGGGLFGRTGHNPARIIKTPPTPRASIGCPSHCNGCGETMVPRGIASESVKYAARGLCETCYSRVRYVERRVAS